MKDRNDNKRPPRSEAESLARSHSIISNIKLTTLAVFASLFFGAFFISLGYYAEKDDTVFLALAIGSGVMAAVLFFMIRRFRR